MNNKLRVASYELRVAGCGLCGECPSNDIKAENNPQPASGFTLIEIIIALTIGTVIILVSTIALRIGLSHMSNGEEWLNKTVREATTYDFFWQQVSSIRTIEIPKPASLLESLDEDNSDKDKTVIKKVYFKGAIDSMSFITPLSLKRHYGYGLIIATYWQRESDSLEGFDLVYKEKRFNPAVLSSISAGLLDLEEEMDEVIIFEGCEDIGFEYLKAAGNTGSIDNESLSNVNEGSSFQEWVGTIENSLPKAIKIVIKKEGIEKELIAPVMVMYSL
ncbi:MAG: PulJ/GspJ family protein [Candidatus Anammoxibacter sp.]